MVDKSHEIFAGMLIVTTDNFLLAPFNGGAPVDLEPHHALTDDRFDRHAVSVLGRMGERAIDGSRRVRSLQAVSIVSQADIAARAFNRHRSNPAAPALDNWLHAERELLESAV